MTDRVAGPTKKMKCAVKQAGGSVQFCLGDLTRLPNSGRGQYHPPGPRRPIKTPARIINAVGVFSRIKRLVDFSLGSALTYVDASLKQTTNPVRRCNSSTPLML